MKNLNIRNISLYGFLTIVAAILFIAFFIYIVLGKYQKLDDQHYIYEKAYTSMLEYKYYTERLLTTYDLTKEKQLWINSKNNFKKSMDQLNSENITINNEILQFYNVINSESAKVVKKLQHEVFTERNVMEKSILRRLGEGLNSNEKSNYYLAITDLKNNIDYLKQYEEFLLDELRTLTEAQKKILVSRISKLKSSAFTISIVTILFGIVFIYFIQKLIGKLERTLIKTKNNLQETLDETNYILNASMESIIITKNNLCIDVNKATLGKFGYKDKKEIIGKPFTQFIAPSSIKLTNKKQTLDIVEPYEAECITKEGKIMYSLIQEYNYKNKQNETIRVSAIVDLTKVKAQEQLLFQQSKMATMGEMLENITHQWRQPLSIISAAASGIKVKKEYGIENKEEEMEILDTINNSVQHLSATIDDFRNFFKPNRKKERFNICHAFKKTEELMSSKLKNRSIKIIKDTQKIDFLGYENEFIQAFMNIVNNAKDALEEKEMDEKLIFLTIKKVQNKIIITIKDNAGGIPQDILPDIFKEHFTTKGDKEGTGIGLYMTQMIIEKIKGTIKAQNETFQYNGKTYTGAVFIIELNLPENEKIEDIEES